MKSRFLPLYLFALFGCGVTATAAGFLGWLYPALSLVLIAPLFFLSVWVGQTALLWKNLGRSEKILLIILCAIWLVHLTGIFVPETGFDAVWYHLPIVDQFVLMHRIFYVPDFFQSLNPQFSDLIFLL